jgi:hypothetical protein
MNSDKQWAHFCRAPYLKHGKPIHYHVTSSISAGIKVHLRQIADHSLWLIGNGNDIRIWTDRWLERPIVDILNIHAHLHSEFFIMLVSDYILHGN